MNTIAILVEEVDKWGGIQTVVKEQYESFKNKYNTKVIVYKENLNDMIKNNYCLNSRKQGKSKIKQLFNLFKNGKKIAKYCKKNKIETLISHWENPNFTGLISKIFFNKKIKIICVVHNAKYFNSMYSKYICNILYPFAYKIVCVSNWVKDLLSKIVKSKNIITIFNPFDINGIKKKLEIPLEEIADEKIFENKKYTYINIWRLSEQKGQKNLIESFSRVFKENTNTQLIIIGEGELRKQLEKTIKDNKMEQHIHLLWLRKNIFPYLKKSDCFVFPSLREGLPTVLIEAIISKTPIIANDCKSWPREILEAWSNYDYPIKTKYWFLIEEWNTWQLEYIMKKIQKMTFKYNKNDIEKYSKKNILKQWNRLLWNKL